MWRLLLACLCVCVWVDTASATVTSTAYVNGSQAVIFDSAGNVVSGFGGGSSSLISYGAPEIEMAGVLTGEATTLGDRKSTRLNSSHGGISRMPSSA